MKINFCCDCETNAQHEVQLLCKRCGHAFDVSGVVDAALEWATTTSDISGSEALDRLYATCEPLLDWREDE